jgi:glycosyltransferase involved in cell wall biosynthesis
MTADRHAEEQERGQEADRDRGSQQNRRELDPAGGTGRLGDLHGTSSGGRRPRILLVVTLAEVGGAQTYVASLLPALVPQFDVTVAAHGPGPLREAAEAAGARFQPLRDVRRAVNPWRDVAGLVELARLIRRERPDVLHVSSSKAGVLGRLAAAAFRVPVRIFTVHGWAFAAHSGAASRLYRLVDRLVAPLTTVTICVSENDRVAGLAARTCTAERTILIPNAVELPAVRRPSSTERKVPVFIAVGRLRAPKDFVTFVRALGKLPPGSFEAVIVGEGPDRALLEHEIDALGLAGRVRLMGERRDVPELLADADVFVLPSRSEGHPVAILEAMATGLPVVASRVGGVPEQVSHGETGLLVEPGDPERLAGALGSLATDPALRLRLGAAGRERAERFFDLDAFRRAHVELYSRELARSSALLPTP